MTEVVVHQPPARMGFDSAVGFDLLLRAAKGFSTSLLVPKAYQGPEGVGSCCIALEMANRMGASPLMVMQNLYIVHGNPSWSSKFLIACFNQCGRFSALRYHFERDAKGNPIECRAWAIEKATGERIDGPIASLAMAKAEGWSTKTGSKWITMPELMLMYRAAAFLIRVYAPEISMGLQTAEEVYDLGDAEVVRPATTTLAQIKANAAPANDVPPDPAGDEPTPPTYAELMDRINKAESHDVLAMIWDDLEVHEPSEQREELTAAFNARATYINAKDAA